MLITGEPGTGKALLAETIHSNSRRKNSAFVTVDIGCIPRDSVASELFGHLNGAVVRTIRSRVGQLVAASGGTIYLHDIARLPSLAQAKLLRALERGVVCPIGGNADHRIETRVVAGTRSAILDMAQGRKFREDLLSRLNVVNLSIPPLRNRRNDIPLLVRYFLVQACHVANKPIPSIDAKLWEFLHRHEWPGNVRQLRDCVEGMASVMSGGALTTHDLPPEMRPHHSPQGDLISGQVMIPPEMKLADLERLAIEQALARNGMNRTRAADCLGISLRTLQRKLRLWGQ
jgi:DNA-binding NtrC family response regulator